MLHLIKTKPRNDTGGQDGENNTDMPGVEDGRPTLKLIRTLSGYYHTIGTRPWFYIIPSTKNPVVERKKAVIDMTTKSLNYSSLATKLGSNSIVLRQFVLQTVFMVAF